MAVVIDDLLCYAYVSGTRHGGLLRYVLDWAINYPKKLLNRLVAEPNALMGGVKSIIRGPPNGRIVQK